MENKGKGIVAAVGSYIVWGIVPIYWKQLESVSSDEVISSRIIWAFVSTLLFVILLRQGKQLLSDVQSLWQNKKAFWSLFAASYLISINWFVFIWAVNNGKIIETSLGYYINPLVSVILGVIFLKESLSKAQLLACLIALSGVLVLVFAHGQFPFVALTLAFTFGIYGLLKKKIALDATRGLVIETFFIVPLALIYYIYLIAQGHTSLFHSDVKLTLLLIGTGVVTATPLILFAIGAQNIPLYLVGFFQYIAPTLSLIIGAVLYNEQFGKIELTAFSFIWVAIILFSISTIMKPKLEQKSN